MWGNRQTQPSFHLGEICSGSTKARSATNKNASVGLANINGQRKAGGSVKEQETCYGRAINSYCDMTLDGSHAVISCLECLPLRRD